MYLAFSVTGKDDLLGDVRPCGTPVKEFTFAAALIAFGMLNVVTPSS